MLSHIIIVHFDIDGRFQRCFLMLGGAAYFATKGVEKVGVRPIIRVVVGKLVASGKCILY